jgi:hypothetical protein
MACIANTLLLETFWVSAALLPELKSRGDIDFDEKPLDFQFSSEERMIPLAASSHDQKSRADRSDDQDILQSFR